METLELKASIDHIEKLIHEVKEECKLLVNSSEDSRGALLETTADIMEGLEKAFELFGSKSDHGVTFSPKDNEPWD